MSVATASAVLRVRLTSTISRALPRVTAASAMAHPTWPVPTMPSFIRLLRLDFQISADPASLFPLAMPRSFLDTALRRPSHGSPDLANEKVDEQAHLHSEVSRWRVERVQRERRRMIVRKDAAQCAVLQFLLRNEHGHHRDAASPGSRIAEHLGIVGAQRPFRRNPVVAIHSGQLPLVPHAKLSLREALVMSQPTPPAP